MSDKEYTKEQMEAQRQEVSRLRSDLKAFNQARAQMSKEEKEQTREQAKELQDKYDYALACLNAMKDYFRWFGCVDREFNALYLDD